MYQHEDRIVNRYIIIFSAVASATILIGGIVLLKCLHVQSVHVAHHDRAVMIFAGSSLQKEEKSGDDCSTWNQVYHQTALSQQRTPGKDVSN